MTWRGYYPMGRNTATLYAEYRDEVDKYNKKQEVLLQRHLRIIRRQERMTESVIKKCRHEVNQLKLDIKNTESHSMDLSDYDTLKDFRRIIGSNAFNNRIEPTNSHIAGGSEQDTPRTGPKAKLPPIWQRNEQELTGNTQAGTSSRYMGAGQPKAMSMRALRIKKKLLEPIETAMNSHRRDSRTESKHSDTQSDENEGGTSENKQEVGPEFTNVDN